MKTTLVALALGCLCTLSAWAAGPNKHSPTTKYPSYDGLIMAGYQGWFRVGRDGRMYTDEARMSIDLWPDVSEYEKTYPTGLKLADGSTARFFNSADKSTVDLHFKWMKDNDMWRYRDVIKGDMKWCKDSGVDYVPCVCPGFSWHNLSMHAFPDDVKPVGSIPRQGGRFYWQQISTALGAGADKLYVAMFDEVNEGTAIFKCTDHPPVSNVAKFIDMDGKPSDHYLWLTGEAAKMLRKEKPLSTRMPVRDSRQLPQSKDSDSERIGE